MALAIEGSISSANTTTWSHTTNGTTTLLVVTIDDSDITVPRDVTGVTFNGDALTFHSQYVGVGNDRIEFWYRLNPDPSTTGDIVVTLTGGGAFFSAAGINFSGNDTATPLGTMIGTNSGSTTSWSINISSAAGDICLDCAIAFPDEAADLWQEDAGQTEQWRFTNELFGQSAFGSTEPAVGATTAMGWSRTGVAGISAAGVAVKFSSFNPATVVGPNSERASGGMVGLNRLRL